MNYKINQYQDVFFLNDKNIIVDYLLGTIEIIDKNDFGSEIDFEYSYEYEEYQKKLNSSSKQEFNKNEYTIVIIPSYRCNMECEYCYEGHQKFISNVITKEECETIINYIKDSHFEKVNFILLGGEPIFKDNLDVFKYFFKKIKLGNLKYNVSCVSNGLEVIDNIRNITEIGIKQFQITIDGLEHIHNSRKKSKIKNKNPFIESCNAINILLENDIEVALRINVDQSNVKEICDIGKLICEKKWNMNKLFSAYIYPVTYSGNDELKKYESECSIMKKVVNELEKKLEYKNIFMLDFHGLEFIDTILNNDLFIPQIKFCSSCSNQIVFDGNKNIYTCWWGASNEDFRVGTYNKMGIEFDEKKIREWHNHSVFTIEKCNDCKYRFICGGGCVFKSYTKYKTIEEGNCADFYNLIKTYLSYVLLDESLYQKILKHKVLLIEDYIDKGNILKINVQGTSMEPALFSGSYVYIGSAKERLNTGDIVLYVSDEELKVHRIVGWKSKEICTIKGDNEDYKEDYPVNNILGKVLSNADNHSYSGSLSDNIENYKINMDIKNNEIVNIAIENTLTKEYAVV